MPQLSSGRHVAISPTPLNQLIDDILHERTLALWPLLAISSPEDCLAFFEVIYFVEKDAEDKTDQASNGNYPPELMPAPTGLSPVDVLSEDSEWTADERHEFKAFLSSERAQNFLQKAYDDVKDTQELLRTDGSFLQKWQALTWQAGCHPLQDQPED